MAGSARIGKSIPKGRLAERGVLGGDSSERIMPVKDAMEPSPRRIEVQHDPMGGFTRKSWKKGKWNTPGD